MKGSDKDFDVSTFEHFCETLAVRGHNTYFEDLENHRGRIAANIRGDYDPFLGIYVAQGSYDKVVGGQQLLQAELEVAKAFDVRVLRARERELDGEMEANRQQAIAIEKEWQALRYLLETGMKKDAGEGDGVDGA